MATPHHSFDFVGRRFGLLTVVALHSINKHRSTVWTCRCDCGQTRVIPRRALMAKRRLSCGCAKGRFISEAKIVHGHSRRIGDRRSEYRTWALILQRCQNPKNPRYKQYGGRGITVCPQWNKFVTFLEDMGTKPSKSHSVERRDNNGPYSPENCYWGTKTEQARNRRSNVHLTHQGRTMLMIDWAKELGIKLGTLSGRYRKGWSVDRILAAIP